jgi:hypothetical protein
MAASIAIALHSISDPISQPAEPVRQANARADFAAHLIRRCRLRAAP